MATAQDVLAQVSTSDVTAPHQPKGRYSHITDLRITLNQYSHNSDIKKAGAIANFSSPLEILANDLSPLAPPEIIGDFQ